MITKEELAALEEFSSPRNEQPSAPREIPQNTSGDAAPRVGESDNLPARSLLPVADPLALPLPLDKQLENLRLHLQRAHQLVGRELYAVCESKLPRLTAADKSTLQTGLLRIANEIHDITQMVEQCQLAVTFAKTK